VPTGVADVLARVGEVAAGWREDRPERQTRRHLDQADFDTLRDTGLLTLCVPVEDGGLWQGPAASIRDLSSAYRTLASADPSVALVSSMHPSVVAFWLASPDPGQPEWEAQRHAVFASAVRGEQWATITSEPGSGGDIGRTRSVATPIDAEHSLPGSTYAVSGDKHFGSGSGVVDHMMTTAIPAGEDDPTIFVLDVRDRPWDGTAGMQLIAEWDGMGMAATQSHAMRLDDMPSVRLGWNGPLETITRAAAPMVSTLFTAVVVGVLDEAVTTARAQVRARADSFRAFERVEWARAEKDHWLAVQAYEGAVRSIEDGPADAQVHATLCAKQSVADLAEETLLRITRVLGGGTFSSRSPFARWFEDVRALGFLRPRWGLAYDHLFSGSM